MNADDGEKQEGASSVLPLLAFPTPFNKHLSPRLLPSPFFPVSPSLAHLFLPRKCNLNADIYRFFRGQAAWGADIPSLNDTDLVEGGDKRNERRG